MLEIKDLHATINGKEILKGINLTVKSGEVHAIMGPNGSGKSTFLNQILANALSLGFNGFLYSGELTYQMIMEWFAKTVANTKHLSICTNNFGQYVRLSDEGFEMIF